MRLDGMCWYTVMQLFSHPQREKIGSWRCMTLGDTRKERTLSPPKTHIVRSRLWVFSFLQRQRLASDGGLQVSFDAIAGAHPGECPNDRAPVPVSVREIQMKNILLALFLIGQLFLSVAYCRRRPDHPAGAIALDAFESICRSVCGPGSQAFRKRGPGGQAHRRRSRISTL
jgi:hypothetical protein